MADTLEAFYARLGAFAEPVNRLADAACGCALAGAGDAIEGSEAISRITAQYAALAAQAESLRRILLAGGNVPCKVWSAYGAAWQDYVTKSQAVFTQLAAQGIAVEQVVYADGKPKLDPSDATKVQTVRVQAPLRPPTFPGIEKRCPGTPAMLGGFAGAASTIDAATVAAFVDSTYTVFLLVDASGTLAGLAAHGAFKVLKPTAVRWTDFAVRPSHILASYTARAAALHAAQATPAVTSKALAGTRLNFGLWTWLGIGAGVLAVGGLLLYFTRRNSAARLAGALPPPPRNPRNYSRSGDPILLGDLYLHPRSNQRGR